MLFIDSVANGIKLPIVICLLPWFQWKIYCSYIIINTFVCRALRIVGNADCFAKARSEPEQNEDLDMVRQSVHFTNAADILLSGCILLISK